MSTIFSFSIDFPLFSVIISFLSLSFTLHYFFVRYPLRTKPIRVTGIYYYPVKSCSAVEVDTAEYHQLGFRFDRQWMIVSSETNNFRTAREIPSMQCIVPKVEEERGVLVISAPGMEELEVPIRPPADSPQVTVPIWDVPVVCSEYADPNITHWLSTYLKLPSKFVTLQGGDERNHQRPLDSFHYPPNADRSNGNKQKHTSFTDGYPFLLASEQSLSYLQTQLPPSTGPVSMLAFRPSIVISSSSLTPFDEDSWSSIRIGSSIFDLPKPCERCIMTTVIPKLGVRNPFGEPLLTLRRIRAVAEGQDLVRKEGEADKVYFAQNMVARAERGVVQIGDEVEVLGRKNEFRKRRK